MDLSDISWALIAITVSLILYNYLTMKSKYKYWKKKNVSYEEPLPIAGNILRVWCLQNSIGQIYEEMYKKFPHEKVVGMYEAMKPVLIVRDPKLLEKILVKDFNYFVDHENMFMDSLFKTVLFQIKGSKWRSLRYKLSPAFTTGKLKMVFNGMLDCTDEMIKLMKQNLHKDYEVRQAVTNFTIDVIANTVFGIQISDTEARKEFAKKGNSIFNVNIWRYAQMMCVMQFPKLAKVLGFKSMEPKTEEYFRNIIQKTFEQRLKGNIQRNDYLDHLIKLKEKGFIEVQNKDEDDSYLELDNIPPPESVEITEELLVGQAFQFLTAGFDPLFNTMLFVMYDMCRYPETQKKAREEIKEVLERNGGYSYKAVKEMTYLEQCVQESLRLHTLTPFLNRTCTKKYKTDFGLEIENGQKIIIPLNALHVDPKYFPNPEAYIPERQPPNTARSNYTYLPFGDGPRMCIGLRFALVELKLGMAKIIENFEFTLSRKTRLPLEINKMSFILLPKQTLYFNLTPA